MKRLLLSLFLVLFSVSFVAVDAEAGRLGGGRTSGMKRTTPAPQEAQSVPAKPAAAPNTATPAAAQATPPKRSWLGPIAGLAAGLGLAALMSHLGLGAEFANILMVIMLVAVAVFAVRFLLRRFGPGSAQGRPAMARQDLSFAGAGPAFGSGSASLGAAAPATAVAQPTTVRRLPAGFDAPAFERIAKLIFIRMQAANDAGDLNDLRQFATPEMFANFRLDLQERKSAPQQTDVVQLDAEVLDFEATADEQIVSVRFHGLIREDQDSAAVPFDEVWHLVKPADNSREWAIAGIAQGTPS